MADKPWRVVYDHKPQLVYLTLDSESHEEQTGEYAEVLKWAKQFARFRYIYADGAFMTVEVPNGSVKGVEGELRAIMVVVTYGGPMPSETRREAYRKWTCIQEATADALGIEYTEINNGFGDNGDIEQPDWLLSLMNAYEVMI